MLRKLSSHFSTMRARLASWRRPILLAAALAFVAGAVWSWRQLDVSLADLHLGPLLLLAGVMVPLTIAYSALNMMLMGRAVQVPVSFAGGVRISAVAQVAELLPIPGGLLVRTAALTRGGSSVFKSSEIVLAFALLWIACGLAGAGLALFHLGWLAQLTALAGLGGVAVLHGWIAWRFGHGLALAATGLRLLGLLLMAMRLMAAFAVVGVALPWLASLSFAFAAIAGSAASIVPAGLGVSEGLSALLAGFSEIAPAAAFLAAAISRLAGFAVNMALALGFGWFGRAEPGKVAHV